MMLQLVVEAINHYFTILFLLLIQHKQDFKYVIQLNTAGQKL